MEGKGVRVGKGLGVVVIVQVGKGVRVDRGVLEILAVGESVGWGVAVNESAISAMAVFRSNVGGNVVFVLKFVVRRKTVTVMQIKIITTTPMITIKRVFFFIFSPSEEFLRYLARLTALFQVHNLF